MNALQSDLLNDLRTNRDFLMALLDQPIVFHKIYIEITGSITAALMLSYSTQVSEELDPSSGGWFAQDSDAWEQATGLSRKEQSNARRRLRELGLLDERRQGMPAHIEFRVNFQKVASSLHAVATRMRPAGTARIAPESAKESLVA